MRNEQEGLFEEAQLSWLSEDDLAQTHMWLDEGFALSREVGDKESIANGFSLWGMLALSQGDTAGAASRVEQALALFQEMKWIHGILPMRFAPGRRTL